MKDKTYETIKRVFMAKDGIAHTYDITREGIHNSYLNTLVQKGSISRIRRGVYEWIEAGPQDETTILKRLFPDAIICMESALFFYDYTDRTPNSWHLAFNRNINKKRLKVNYPSIKPYYFSPHIYETGVSPETVSDSRLHIYDRDRTICDIIRYRNRIDQEIFNMAIRSYLGDKYKNIQNLLWYAKMMRIHSSVKHWIGVWL